MMPNLYHAQLCIACETVAMLLLTYQYAQRLWHHILEPSVHYTLPQKRL